MGGSILEASLCVPPQWHRCRQFGAAGNCQFKLAEAAIPLTRRGTHQPLLLQRTQVAREGGPLKPEQIGQLAQTDWLGLVERCQDRELSGRERQRTKGAIIMACSQTGLSLCFQAQARPAHFGRRYQVWGIHTL